MNSSKLQDNNDCQNIQQQPAQKSVQQQRRRTEQQTKAFDESDKENQANRLCQNHGTVGERKLIQRYQVENGQQLNQTEKDKDNGLFIHNQEGSNENQRSFNFQQIATLNDQSSKQNQKRVQVLQSNIQVTREIIQTDNSDLIKQVIALQKLDSKERNQLLESLSMEQCRVVQFNVESSSSLEGQQGQKRQIQDSQAKDSDIPESANTSSLTNKSDPRPKKLSEQISFEFDNLSISRSSITGSELGYVIQNQEDDKNPHLLKQKSSPVSNNDQFFSTQDVQTDPKKTDESPERIIQRFQEDDQQSKVMPIYPEQQQQKLDEIIKLAEKERVSGTYGLFLEYVQKYDGIYRGHQNLIQSITCTIQSKRRLKVVPSYMIRDHFQQYSNLCRQFYQKCYSYKTENYSSSIDKEQSNNQMLNIKEELGRGFEQLLATRRGLGNNFNRIHEKAQNYVIKDLQKAFDEFEHIYSQSFSIFQKTKLDFADKFKKYTKIAGLTTITFSKIMDGKFNQQDDIFIELSKFAKADRDIKISLSVYAKSSMEFRKTIMKADISLFEEVSNILKNFERYCSNNYVKIQSQNLVIDFAEEITRAMDFQKLCSINDIDYVNNLEEMISQGSRKANRQLQNLNFERILGVDWGVLNRLLGDCSQFLKGGMLKTFQLKSSQKELVATLVNNLVEFQHQTLECADTMLIKNLTLHKQQQSVVILFELSKRLIFDSTRTIKVDFKNPDNAQEFVLFLQNKLKN